MSWFRDHDAHRKLDDLLNTQNVIIAMLELVIKGEVETMAQIDDLTTQMNEATNKIAAELDALKLQAGQAVTQAQVDALTKLKDRLTALGADPSNPVPDAPATPATP